LIMYTIQETWTDLDGIEMHPIFFQLGWNLDGDWPIRRQNPMAFLGGEEGAALCIALLCTIVLRRRLNSKKRSTWARKWHRRQRWDVFLGWVNFMSCVVNAWLLFSNSSNHC
jgi:hypothetical protein